MGAICIDFDPYGWGQSEAEYGKNSHQTDRAHVIQALECRGIARLYVEPSQGCG